MESKRRRVDNDYAQPGASTSRGGGSYSSKQPANRQAELTPNRNYSKDQQHYVPVLNLATLPPAALQRYLTRYNLIEPHGTLSYHHAVFPVPPLPAEIVPPLDGRTLLARRARHSSLDESTDSPDGVKSKKRRWLDPKTAEFAHLTAFDGPDVVVERLAERARQHWDKRENVKEGETLTNFVFSLRMRAHTLRATPPG